jgi:hypothetical protein
MKQKALVIGALPSPFVGPWVEISDRAEWHVRPLPEHNQKLKLVVEDPRVASPTEIVFDGQAEIVFSGLKARVEILEEFDSHSVTVIAEEVVRGRS